MERTQVLETTPAQINVRGLVCLLTHILSERMVTERVLWWASGAVSWAFRDYVTSCSWADTWCPTDLRTTTPEFERETKPRTSALEEGAGVTDSWTNQWTQDGQTRFRLIRYVRAPDRQS
jgi:hypothetical protein